MIRVYIDGVDRTDRLLRFQVRRGRASEMLDVQPGQAVLQMDNRDRLFDPSVSTAVRVGSSVRIAVVSGSVEEPIFVGFVEQVALRRSDFGRMIAEITALDALSRLSTAMVSLSRPAERTDQRIAAILDAVDPSLPRSLSTGRSVMMAESVSGDALSACRQAAWTEGIGMFLARRDGYVEFLDRHAPLKPPLRDPVWTIPSSLLKDIEVRYDIGNVRNLIRVDYSGGSASAQDAVSISAYGQRAMHLDLRISGAHEAQSAAQWWLSIFKDVQPRVEDVEIDVRALSDALVAARLEIGRKIQLDLPGFGPSSLRAIIERLEWNWEGARLFVRIGLSAGWPEKFWVWGYSRAGVDTIFAY
jgi:hypothetical protein